MAGTPEGRSKGGLTRAKNLTPERRREIAQKAIAARWGEKPLKATHKGSFQKEFGIDVECYVLDDEDNTAVISQRGMAELLGLGEGGSQLKRFVEGERVASVVGVELREELKNPVIFQGLASGLNANATPTTHGYPGGTLIRLCRAIVKADNAGFLLERQKHIAQRANVILQATAELGIRDLVYAISGFDSTREKTIAAFRNFVRKQAREWEKEFPAELYDHWYRLYQIPRPDRSHPWLFCKITREHVYLPLAKSNGALLSLIRDKRDEAGVKRTTRLHQFLSEVGVKVFRRHMGKVLGIASISDTQEEYEKYIQKWLEREQGPDVSNEDMEMLLGETK